MAQVTDKSSTFTILASALAVSLFAAGGIFYLQSGSSGDSGGNAAALAAVSQAMPLHTAVALAGDTEGFRHLKADVDRLATLRQSTSSMGMPGGAAAWDNLERHAKIILERQDGVESITAAAELVRDRMPEMLQASDALLDQSGATAVVQEFQRRGATLQTALSGLLAEVASGGGAGSLEAIADDLAFLRTVTEALSGETTNLDVRALDDATREVALVPVISELMDIESQLTPALVAAGNLGDLGGSVAELNSVAATLLGGAFSPKGSGGGGLIANPYLPLALLAISILLVAGLVVLHSKASVFERTSREQTDQNERNQQAILRLLDELGSLADGDLTVEATVTEDITGAIADSINYAIEKLRELVATINETAIMVDSAAKTTASTAVHMARAAETQTKEISAATESIVSMAGSIEEVSGNAERSSDVARHSVEVAHKGGEAVRRTIDGMNAIRETIQETSKRIKRLGESSQEIGNIIELINDIAEQTNILALNASIQASMAGEAGRGFAVVADEVQRLAERSTNATKQIEVLVRTIQTDTNEAVISMERSTTDVVGGALLAENAGAALDEIEQVSNQIANLVQNISGSARQQAGSAADVTRRTTKLKEISDQTGRATTATAASISKLSALASQLRQTVAGFTLPTSALQGSPLAKASINSPSATFKPKEKAAG
ncbi:MAG: methyl-accepting chemotaxis protein [Proteobacteria bacterium]|nr:methyl-accepting chemotaxis protein [Pseudomonadota bacterium]MDA0993129.1 methyl-accepting chemotaxis protein [Pseudomonadota bacterium]